MGRVFEALTRPRSSWAVRYELDGALMKVAYCHCCVGSKGDYHALTDDGCLRDDGSPHPGGLP